MTAVYTLAQTCLQQHHPHTSDSINTILSGTSPSNSSISGSPVTHHGICIASLSGNTGSNGRNRRRSSHSSSNNNNINQHGFTHHTSHVNGFIPSNNSNNHNNIISAPAPILSVSPPKHRSSAPAPATNSSSLTNLIISETKKAAFPVVASTTRIPTPAPSAIADLPPIHSLSVIETFNKVLADVDIDECEAAGENAFLVCDLARVWERYLLWQRELGDRVEPFFAVKCNPDPVIVALMARLGLGFDCASHQEIASVLAAGVHPDKIIYANPCKASSFIRHAAKANVDMMTFDNADELAKVSKFHKNAKMVLRILTDDSGSLCKLGLKFGAPLAEVRPLLAKAKELKVDVIGISFHVGSGCTNPNLFADAVERARWAFDIGAELGFNFIFLDVGGGFGGDNFVEIASILRPAIERCFPAEEGVRVIAEPGRYFVAEAFEMATNVIARRGKGTGTLDDEDVAPPPSGNDEEDEEEAIVMYYINDGVYGAFNCTMFDHQVVHPKVLTLGGRFIASPDTQTDSSRYEPCSVWGPTCDSIDCVSARSYLPTTEVRVGDWLRWENMGAYTICAASQFNGFKQSKVVYTIDADSHIEKQIRYLLGH